VTSEANTIANFGLRPLAAIQDGTLIHHSLTLVPISLPKMSVPVHFIPMTISVKTTENPPTLDRLQQMQQLKPKS
jgi:hypothetical protein